MLSRLWQCAEPTWWEQLLGLPLTAYVLCGLLIIAPLASGWRGRGASLLRLLALCLGGALTCFVVLGVFCGLLFRFAGFNPSCAYQAVRWLWLLTAWPLVGVAIWSTAKKGERLVGKRTADRIGLFAVSAVMAGGSLLIIVLARGETSAARLARWVIDDNTSWFQTDECLAEHVLEYLSHEQVAYDFGRLPGERARKELYRRRRHVDRRVFATALHSYHLKVRERARPEPETLSAVCRACPGVAAELDEWIKDEQLSEKTRSLAEVARSRM